MAERWAPIPGWEGRYEASTEGRVRSIITIDARGRRCRPRILRPSLSKDHLKVTLSGPTRQGYVHTFVLEAFVGPRPPGLEACHRDGDYENNALSNLRWDTRSSNALDRVRHGTHNESSKTQCKRGHPLAGENLYPVSLRLGVRKCVACQRAHNRARKNGTTVEHELARFLPTERDDDGRESRKPDRDRQHPHGLPDPRGSRVAQGDRSRSRLELERADPLVPGRLPERQAQDTKVKPRKTTVWVDPTFWEEVRTKATDENVSIAQIIQAGMARLRGVK